MGNFNNDFRKHLSDSGIWNETKWLGIPILKMPLDIRLYQEIIFEVQPDVIIETGAYNGGSALFFASMLELIGKGKVVSIGSKPESLPVANDRIHCIQGSSVAEETILQVKDFIQPADIVLVSLNGENSKHIAFREMEIYHPLVTVGSYLILDNPNISGYSIFGTGALEAIGEFLAVNDQFKADTTKQEFFLVLQPNGFLKKIK